MIRHQENLYKTINITYHGKYTPYPSLYYRPYDGTMCPVKGLYHEMHSIVIACRGAGNTFIFSHSGCFTLTSSSFVHLQFFMTVQSGATQSYNLYGCIHRIG